MRISPVKTTTRKASIAALICMSATAMTVQACTDLSETPVSAISPDNYYRTQAEVIGGLAGVYAGLRNTLDEYWNISEVSSCLVYTSPSPRD